jgi:NAD(P)-dependent dehydrogenase (short-subunit alcohol dehydrogenase family)
LPEGKRALITGGSTGLGLAIAGRFRREGARVVITGRDHDLGERAGQALGPGARFVAADAAGPDAVASSVRAAADHLGGLDVLVNNAGVGVTARLADTPPAGYDRVMNVNVRGYLLYAQQACPHLARRRGCMIRIASGAGIWGEQVTGLYSVTKAAVVMPGKMLALDGGRDGGARTCCARAASGPACGTWPRPASRTGMKAAASGRCRRPAGSARPATWPPRRCSTRATRPGSSPGPRC